MSIKTATKLTLLMACLGVLALIIAPHFAARAHLPPFDTAPPSISIVSPENRTYSIMTMPLTFTSNKPVSWASFSLDSQSNVTITGNSTLLELQEGTHTIIVFANDTEGNMGSSQTVHFSVVQLDLFETSFLAAVQGIAEWLPISSTGHLRLAEHFMLGGASVPLLLDIILHVGTLIVILAFFRKDIQNVLSALVHRDFKSEDGKLIPLILVGTIPTGLIGLLFSDLVESVFQNVLPIAVALLFSGTLLYCSKFGAERTDKVTYLTALILGAAQGIAIIPGVSRSGTTIAVALLLGLKREKALRFSFLLSIPSIIGALGLLAYKEHEALALTGIDGTEILVATVIAILVGYVALRILFKAVENKRFHFFAFYCWLLGTTLIVLTLNGF